MSWFNDEIQTKIISAMVASHSTYGKAQMDFISSMIKEFESSQTRKYMDVASDYYKNKTDIQRATRKIIGRTCDDEPTLLESKTLANNKISHDFLRKLTRQKISYMLGKPFILEEKKRDDTEAQQFFEDCHEYFNQKFLYTLKNVGRDSIVKGIGWLQVYYDEKGELKFRRCEPEEVIPFWRDNDCTELDAVIRKYVIYEYVGGEKNEITYIEYYLPEGVFYYKQDKHGLHIDEERRGKQHHFQLQHRDEKGNIIVDGINWSKIPFISFKYDAEGQTLLHRIKDEIDDYDRKTSGASNMIDDFPNSVTVIKNYDGTNKHEFVQQKNEFRTIFVNGDGDAKSLETPLNIEEIDKHLERLRQDIYEFGQGVNTADKDIRDTSGVALRFIYADLDMDCVDWSTEVRMSLQQVIWFIQQDIAAKKGIDYSNVEYSITFDTDVIVNETETINNCAVSKELISQKTIAARHPWTINAAKEVEEVNKHAEDVVELEHKYDKNPTTTNKNS